MFGNNNGFSLADLAAVSGNGFGNFGGEGGLWILILFILFFGGFGGGFGGWGMNGLGFGLGMDNFMMWPWMMTQNTDNIVQGGFNQQTTSNALNNLSSAVTSGFGDTALGIAGINQNICQSTGAVTQALNNGFSQAEIAAQGRNSALTQQLYNNEIANLERSYNAQTASTAGLNSVENAITNCCCRQDANSADLKYTIATENAADRAALSDGLRDVLAATQAQTQTILDKLCQQEIDNLKSQNVALQNQVNMQNLAASQAAQTASLIADNTAQTQYIVNRVAPVPVPAYPVNSPYGPYFGSFNGFGYGPYGSFNNLVA